MRLNRFSTLATAIALTSPAAAQPYYGDAPPVTIYAPPPPPASPPTPPVVIGQAIGGFVGGIVSLPFNILESIFAPPVPLVPDGQGGWVPATNSRYDPVTGQFLPPAAYQVPDYSHQGRSSKRRHAGSGCFASDGTRLRNTGECATDPRPIPDTSKWREPD